MPTMPNDDELDETVQAYVEKQRSKDRWFDTTANTNVGSYLVLPGPSQDVRDKEQQDAPAAPTAEDVATAALRTRLERYKNAVALGIFSDWVDCTQADGVEKRHQTMTKKWAARHPGNQELLSELEDKNTPQ